MRHDHYYQPKVNNSQIQKEVLAIIYSGKKSKDLSMEKVSTHKSIIPEHCQYTVINNV